MAVEDIAVLTKARSMLVILLATCHETLLALEATANILDLDLTHELTAMIERSERELEVVAAKLASTRS